MLKRKKSMKFQTDLVDYKILVVGLEGSGKSSIINMIVNKEKLIDPIQTMGVETIPFESGTVNTKTIIFYEIGGNKHNRGLMKFYYNCHGVIYVIDSSKHDQLIKYECTDSLPMDTLPINSSSPEPTHSSPELSPSPQPTPFSPSPQSPQLSTHNNANANIDTNTKLKKPKRLKISSLITKFEKLDDTVIDETKSENMQVVMEKRESQKLDKLLGNTEITDLNDSDNDNRNNNKRSSIPMFGRSKSAQTTLNPLTPPSDTNSMSFSMPNSARNSFVDKFKRKRNSSSRNKHKPQSSIGSITLTDEHMKFLPKLSPRFSSNTLSLKSGNDILQPLTMNEAKCESAQELISKLNYELKSTDIPFLIYCNKNDEKESLSSEEITKQIEYQRIIDKNREYGIFECDSSNKDQVFNGFNWLLMSMKKVTAKNKQFSKEIELLNRLNSIDLTKYGPNAKRPTCFICGNPCKNTGSYCTVCGKWYCQRDVITKMLMRKSGNSKCRECVGQKSIFSVQDRKQTK